MTRLAAIRTPINAVVGADATVRVWSASVLRYRRGDGDAYYAEDVVAKVRVKP